MNGRGSALSRCRLALGEMVFPVGPHFDGGGEAQQLAGIGGRGRFYEEVGVVRDVVQNHMFQLLSVIAMEPPAVFDAEGFRNEKAKVLQAAHLANEDEPWKCCVRGQYGPGGSSSRPITGYRQEPGVNPNSTTETYAALKAMGDSSLGIITAWHYEYTSKDPKNVTFVKLFNEMHNRNPDFFSIGGYDGMHVIYEALKKSGGKTDGESLIAAAKGLKWDSPRGPMSIDPETRDVVQTIYIRKVEKVNGEPQNVVFDKVENVKDPVKARMPK